MHQRQERWISPKWLKWLIGVLPCLLALPVSAQGPDGTAMTAPTSLQRAVQTAAEQHAPASGQLPLSTPLQAWGARVALARMAGRTLDLQYYIWDDDITGQILLQELRRIADRGVHVRILVDDNGTSGLDDALLGMDAHERIEVRIFNPFPTRWFKPLGYLFDFKRLNHRMHNKSMTADGAVTIVGGRNIGDMYFGAAAQANFVDLDVLLAGPAAREAQAAFERFWNAPASKPVRAVVGGQAQGSSAQALDARVQALLAQPGSQAFVDAVQGSDVPARLAEGVMAVTWVPVRVISDPPEKADRDPDDPAMLMNKLQQAMGPIQRRVDLVSPYFVPGDTGVAALTRLRQAGVDVRVITNSLAATDVAAVHAGYRHYRAALLRAGVRLYEMKPRPDARGGRGLAWSLMGSGGTSSASLHGKTFAVDGERTFVGSLNLDPRSLFLNTEMGAVLSDPALTGTIHAGLDRTLPDAAYEVVLTPEGELRWIEQVAGGQRVHDTEPEASWARRATVVVLSWLPIDWLL